jgi:hypothetical protein
MKKRSYFVLLLLFVLVCSVETPAQKLEVGVFGGGSFFSRPGFSIPNVGTAPTPTPLDGEEPTTEAIALPSTSRIDYIFRGWWHVWSSCARELVAALGLEQSYTFTGTNNAGVRR